MSIRKTVYAALAACLAAMAGIMACYYEASVAPLLGDTLARIAKEEANTVAVLEQGNREALGRLAACLALSESAAPSIEAAAAGEALPIAWQSEIFFINNNLNFMAWLKSDGETLSAKWRKEAENGLSAPPPGVRAALDSRLFLPDSDQTRKLGVLMLDDIPTRVACQRIYAAGSGRCVGFLAIGQLVDHDSVRLMRSTLGAHITALPFASASLPAELRGIAYDFTDRNMAEVEFGSGSNRRVGVVLADLRGDPALALLVEPDTGAAEAAAGAWRQALMLTLAVTLAAAAFLVVFLEKALFTPLGSLADIINRLGSHSYDLTAAPRGLDRFERIRDYLLELIRQLDRHDKEMRRKDEDMLYRAKINEALAQVSRNLLRDGQDGIAKCLRVLGLNLDTDVVSYWQISPDREFMRCIGTFRDAATGKFSGEYDFTAPIAGWIAAAIRHNEHLIINNVNDVPPEMSEVKDFISSYELKSFLGVPLTMSGGRLGGLVAFGDIRAIRTWKDAELRTLGMVAELFVDMIERARRDNEARS